MDKYEQKMIDDFSEMVRARLAEFFSSKDFVFDELKEFPNSGKWVMFYRSPRYKLAIYHFLRDGEINCLIGTVDAKNSDIEKEKVWSYLYGLLYSGKNPGIDELLARVPTVPLTDEEQLDRIAETLRLHFDELVKLLPEQSAQ